MILLTWGAESDQIYRDKVEERLLEAGGRTNGGC